MKDWDALTEAGRVRRLRSVAERALDAYPVTVERLSLIGGFVNALYRVDTPRGPLALRVDLLQEHSEANTRAELEWLEALASETDLDVVRVVPTREGALFTYAEGKGVPNPRRCTLFEWVPGSPLAGRETTERYAQLGRLSAGLHRHGAKHDATERPMRWDRIFYYPPAVDPVVIFEDAHANLLAGGRRTVLDRCISAVEKAFDRIADADKQVVHGDLHPYNVHVVRSRMIALDFEDVMWAHPVQDIAITLYYNQTHPDYERLCQAFRSGYESVAHWPEARAGQIDHFIAARTIMFLNLVINLDHDPPSFFDSAFLRLERYLAAHE